MDLDPTTLSLYASDGRASPFRCIIRDVPESDGVISHTLVSLESAFTDKGDVTRRDNLEKIIEMNKSTNLFVVVLHYKD